jgi:hypothetical protein
LGVLQNPFGMRKFLLAAVASASLQLHAQTPSFTVTLTPEAGGSDTRLSWAVSGTPIISPTPQFPNLPLLGVSFFSGNSSNAEFTVSGTEGGAFATAPGSVSLSDSGISWQNTTTDVSRTADQLSFALSSGLARLDFTWFDAGSIPTTGSEQIVYIGATTGSFLTGIDFSAFNPGSWTTNFQYANYDQNLIISGTPVPEPSTYGMILGGLAFAGAALRRRRKA